METSIFLSVTFQLQVKFNEQNSGGRGVLVGENSASRLFHVGFIVYGLLSLLA